MSRIPNFLLFIAVAILATASTLACSEPDNESIARQQISDSAQACQEGCASPPPGCVIKGNISQAGNKFYHLPDGRNYNGVVIEPERGERWFCNEGDAVENGWRKAFY